MVEPMLLCRRGAVGSLEWSLLAQNCPGDPSKLVCERHYRDVAMDTSGQQSSKPLPDRRITLAERQHRRLRSVHKQGSEIDMPRFVIPSSRDLPMVANWRGTSPNHTPRSRSRLKLLALPTATTKAVAFRTPMPRIAVSPRIARLCRASDTNSAFSAAIFVSSIFHSSRNSTISWYMRGDRQVS